MRANRVVPTNNATYASSTIVEFQSIDSWNGAIIAGTTHCHMFDANDAGTYVGPVTLS